MWQMRYYGRPRGADRPRARFSSAGRHYYMYTSPDYTAYKNKLIDTFNGYVDDIDLQQCFSNKFNAGLSVKIVFYLKGNGQKKLYGMRPDIDNLYKAVIDSLFESKINQIKNGFLVDNNGQFIFDKHGEKQLNFKQKMDDSRVVHTELLKIRVDELKQEGFLIKLRMIGLEEIG